MPDASVRARLLDVAIDLFGHHGVEAVTTRAVAEAAGARQSSVSYYFSTKDRMYLACAEHIASTIRKKVEPLLADSQAVDHEQARAEVERLVGGILRLMLTESASHALFVVREQMNPTPAFAILFDGAIQPIIDRLRYLLRIITAGGLSDEQVGVRCFALIGQAFTFRFARAALLRITAWDDIGLREADLVREVVGSCVRAVLADLEPSGTVTST